MVENFAGKVVLVAGGSGGLGRSISVAFLQQSATVVVTYRQEIEFNDLKNAAGKHSSSLDGYVVDVTDETELSLLVQRLLAAYGKIDVLINAVGAYTGGIVLWETTSTAFEQMIALNLRAGFLLLRAVVPVMLKQRAGSIVNVASQAALEHAAGAAAYVASKAGAVAMIDSLAEDLKGTGVRANSILPSIIDTAANRKAMPTADFSKWPKPDDIARVILFLCSEDARLVHGAAVSVYGNM